MRRRRWLASDPPVAPHEGFAIPRDGAGKFAKIFGCRATISHERQSPKTFGRHTRQWRDRIFSMRASPLLSLGLVFASALCGRCREWLLIRESYVPCAPRVTG
jgi:hypothetical protein